MRAETTRLLLEVRETIIESLGAENVANAISALERSGYRVFVSVEAMPDQSAMPLAGESEMAAASTPFPLSSSDELFLRTMHITS